MAVDLYTQAPIYAAYRELYKRDPRPDELAYWRGIQSTRGMEPSQLVDTIRYSASQAAAAQGGTSETATADVDVMKDDQYTAFLRRMQFDESQIESNLAAQRESIQRQQKIRAGEFDWQRHQSNQAIDRDFANRGLYGAGRRVQDREQAEATINQTQLQYETEQSERQAALQRDAANRIASGRREKQEQELAARRRLTQQSVGK